MTAGFNIRHPLTAAADREPVDISDLAEEWHRNPLAALLRADANREFNSRKAAEAKEKSRGE